MKYTFLTFFLFFFAVAFSQKTSAKACFQIIGAMIWYLFHVTLLNKYSNHVVDINNLHKNK